MMDNTSSVHIAHYIPGKHPFLVQVATPSLQVHQLQATLQREPGVQACRVAGARGSNICIINFRFNEMFADAQ